MVMWLIPSSWAILVIGTWYQYKEQVKDVRKLAHLKHTENIFRSSFSVT